MGASLSSDVYQYKVDTHLENIQNCMAIADDIIMGWFRDDGSDHDRMVRQVLDKEKLWECDLIPTNVSLGKRL